MPESRTVGILARPRDCRHGNCSLEVRCRWRRLSGRRTEVAFAGNVLPRRFSRIGCLCILRIIEVLPRRCTRRSWPGRVCEERAAQAGPRAERSDGGVTHVLRHFGDGRAERACREMPQRRCGIIRRGRTSQGIAAVGDHDHCGGGIAGQGMVSCRVDSASRTRVCTRGL